MKNLSVLVFLVTYSSVLYAHMKPNPLVFFVQYEKGEKYDQSKAYEKQNKIGEHIQFVKKTYHDGHMLLGGVFKEQKFSSFFMEADSQKELELQLNKDPAIEGKIIKYNLKPFVLTMLRKKGHTHSH